VQAGRHRRTDQIGVDTGLRALAAGTVDRDDPVAEELQGNLHGALCLLHPEIADDVGRQARHDPERTLSGAQPVQHGFDRTEPVADPRGVLSGREDDLRVPHALCRKVLTELVGDATEVLELSEQAAQHGVLLDEMEAVPERRPAVGSERLGHRTAVPVRQLTDGLGTQRALEVDVQLRLREPGKVSHAAMVASPG
jgi:hypothetical protein